MRTGIVELTHPETLAQPVTHDRMGIHLSHETVSISMIHDMKTDIAYTH